MIRHKISVIATLSAALSLSGCATARLHSEAELSVAGRACGLSEGELVQETELKKMLFLYRVAPSREVRSCVFRWADKNHMRLAVIEAVNWPQP
ncbi:hypothetical protein [Sphingomonas sp.]|uniref:hypothetical protein n=1 Tax=Sphingomonas sp. TaxID=28214 RepID=UPI00286AC556|nr:hypothetical protein [Sphingomonas sp.]